MFRGGNYDIHPFEPISSKKWFIMPGNKQIDKHTLVILKNFILTFMCTYNVRLSRGKWFRIKSGTFKNFCANLVLVRILYMYRVPLILCIIKCAIMCPLNELHYWAFIGIIKHLFLHINVNEIIWCFLKQSCKKLAPRYSYRL